MQSKEDSIYGVFAAADSSCSGSGSDSDTGGRRGKRRRGHGMRSKTHLTKPVQFVSNGEVMSSQDVTQDEEASLLSTEVGHEIKEGAVQKKNERATLAKEKTDYIHSLKSSTSRPYLSNTAEIGGFAVQTKGIGMKLLEKMGYVAGQGLGKAGQGIVTPLVGKARPKNMGMGFNNYKEPKLLDEPEPVPVLERKVETEAPLSAEYKEKVWSKRRQGRKRALAKEEVEGAEAILQQKVIDMRGPQTRILTSLENLNSNEEKEQIHDVPMKELQHNIRIEIEFTNAGIQIKEKQLKREREYVHSLFEEKKVREEKESMQRKQLQITEVIAGVLDQVQEDNESGLLTLDSLLTTFLDLKNKYRDEYKLCNLSVVACEYAIPLFTRVFHGWDPLQNPLHGLETIRAWQDLIYGDQPYDDKDGNYIGTIIPYIQLVSEVVLPIVRSSCTNKWIVQDPEPMLRFLDSWGCLLPPHVLQSILEHIIIPKLTAAINSWHPHSQSPLHLWVHPWLPLLGRNLETLYHTIQYKLGQVLHVIDASTHKLLLPWKDVLPVDNWEWLTVNHIVPKLRLALQEFKVDRSYDNLDRFNRVIMWADAIPVHYMVHLLEFGFFNMWHQELYDWLSSNPDYNEVWNWYIGWKSVFPVDFLANERVRVLMSTGLDMINQALDGHEVLQPSSRKKMSYLHMTKRKKIEATQQADTGTSFTDLSFKEAIQEYASEQGILFMPKAGKFHNGYQVYDFGTVNIYMDPSRDLLYAQANDGIWSAVSLAQLMDLNRIR